MFFTKLFSSFIANSQGTVSRTRLFKNIKIVEKSFFHTQSRSVCTEAVNVEPSDNVIFERGYFRNIMENNSKYPSCNFSFSKFSNVDTANPLVLKLRNVAAGESTQESDLNAVSLAEHFTTDEFTIDDLIEVFHLLSIPSVSTNVPYETKNLKVLLHDKLKFALTTNRNLDKYLVFLHLVKRFDKRLCHAPVCVIYFLQKKYKYMTNSQIIEFLYFLHFFKGNYTRKETKFGFEQALTSKMAEFTLDEVAVIAYGLFRSQNHPGTLLSVSITERAEEEFANWNEVHASVFSKFFHYSGRRAISNHIHRILQQSVSIIDKFTLTTAVHMCCSGVTVNVENPELVNRTIEKVLREYSYARIKDLERLLLACLHANIQLTEESPIVRLIKENLGEKRNEIEKFPKSFLSLLQYLIMYGIYLDDHINFALSEDCLKLMPRTSMKYKLHELLFIDGSLEIERPDYKGNRISPLQETRISKRDLFSIDDHTFNSSWKCNMEIMNSLQKTYGESCRLVKRILAHYETSHVVLCLNQLNEPQDFGDKLENTSRCYVTAPKDGNKWLCLVGVRRQGFLSDAVTPNFITEAKLRHFKKAGYIPVLIHNHSWPRKTQEEKDSYLREALQNALNNSNN